MGEKARNLFINQLRFPLFPFPPPSFFFLFLSPPLISFSPFTIRYIDQHRLVDASEAGDPFSSNPPPPAPPSGDPKKLPSDTWNLVSVRRETVKAFLKASPARACACCNSPSPAFKKNRDSKIFEKVFFSSSFFFAFLFFSFLFFLSFFSPFSPPFNLPPRSPPKGKPKPKNRKKCYVSSPLSKPSNTSNKFGETKLNSSTSSGNVVPPWEKQWPWTRLKLKKMMK